MERNLPENGKRTCRREEGDNVLNCKELAHLFFMLLNIILSLHKLLFGSLMGRELFLQAWFPTELVSAAALGSKREEFPQSEEPTLPEWVSYGWHM